MNDKPIRVLYAITHPASALKLLEGQLAWMRNRGLDVAVAAAPGPELSEVREREGVEVFPIPFVREVDVRADVRALVAMRRVVRAWEPTVVNASTPKAGLLGMIAARGARVPRRIYTLRGLRLETTAGPLRKVLTSTERIASACAQTVVAVSRSVADTYVRMGLAPADKVIVLGAGSSNGVSGDRFAAAPGARERLRAALEIPLGVPLVGFVGRLTQDKGIADLMEAFGRLRMRHPETQLLLVGSLESGDALSEQLVMAIREGPAVHLTGYVAEPTPYYAAMDVLAFPSYREGFPNVPLEAAAAGVPTAGFQATGTRDAVVDGETGLLVPIGDVEGLARSIGRYLSEPSLHTAHARAARARARSEFKPQRIWSDLLALYTQDRSLPSTT